ncbi:hypothetical protein [Caballeronia sp. dw_19]|uniref:hypothetical protein n=1 Tax=Caballeronia sp. dw_19 TaxID=2719791 RepID=UPI001BD259A5|nr:hypothetical protein [Caballeronia sp. dw_19]
MIPAAVTYTDRNMPAYDVAGTASSVAEMFAKRAYDKHTSALVDIVIDDSSVEFTSNCLIGNPDYNVRVWKANKRTKWRAFYAYLFSEVKVVSLVEENVSVTLDQAVLELVAAETETPTHVFGTARARRESDAPAQMSDAVRSLARRALALKASRAKRAEDPGQWAERITNRIYGE